MDTTRDLAQDDPWLESLERSLARRGKPRRASVASSRPRSGSRQQRRERPRAPLVTAGSLVAVALLAAVVASVFDAGGSQASPTAARTSAVRAAGSQAGAGGPSATSVLAALDSRDLGARGCRHASTPAGYVDPLAAAAVRPERIDQGVDYAGRGTLVAIGAGRITYVATTGTGWPGAFIEYRLLDGADAGCYVFYAEGVTPTQDLHVGEAVGAGQALATIIPWYPTGMELGWGAGKDTKTYAAVAGQWSPTDDQDNVASPAGKSFSALIASLGGPPGKVEG